MTLHYLVTRLDEPTFYAARGDALARGRVLEREGLAIYAFHAAATLALRGGLDDEADLAAVRAALRAIEPVDETSAGHPVVPIALGSLAFDRGARSELVVARLTVVERDGERFALAVGSETELAAARRAFPFAANAAAPRLPPVERPPDAFSLASVRPHEDFEQRVALAVEAIRAGALEKVVLVREVAVEANRPLSQANLLERLRALHPSCLAFAIDGFVGASPELLVRRRDAHVASQPLAGTVARSGDPEKDRRLAASLLASAKDRAEHRYVVDAILEALGPLCDEVVAPEVPHLLELRNVAHLATPIDAVLAGEETARPSALELAAALHPTPAVGGHPRAAALEYLAKHEEIERDRFAGPVGYVDADGDGEFWLGLRSALVEGGRARLFAGVGIVEGSDPAAELAETQLKLQALLAVAVRP